MEKQLTLGKKTGANRLGIKRESRGSGKDCPLNGGLEKHNEFIDFGPSPGT